MSKFKSKVNFPLYSIKEAIEDLCAVIFESVKLGKITDEELAGKYNVGPKTKNYTYKRRSCVEYGLITRKSTNNSLSRIGIQILRSNYYKKSRVKVIKILSFIRSEGMKALLRYFIEYNDSLIYDDVELYDFLLEKGVTKSNIKRIVKAFNESLEYLDIITLGRKIRLNDEYIKIIKSDAQIVNLDDFNRIITKILIEDEREKQMINNRSKAQSIVPEFDKISFSFDSGKSGKIVFRKGDFNNQEYLILRNDLTKKEFTTLDNLIVGIYKSLHNISS